LCEEKKEMIANQKDRSASGENLGCLLCESEDWTPIPHSRAMAKLTIMSLYDSQEGTGV
jgi:hypothetical protein